MKKWLIGLLLFLVILIAGIYVFIPNQLIVSKVTLVKANRNSLMRLLSNEHNWRKWWPVNNGNNDSCFYYNHFNYALNKTEYSRLHVNIADQKADYASTISLIPLPMDSMAIEWKCELYTGFNPVQKIMQYQKAKSIKNNMNVLVQTLKNFAEKNENIYGFAIHRTTLTDTVLVATKMVTQHYPTTEEIYGMIEHLKNYIASQGAKEVNYPMLNVFTKDSVQYDVMVGIPTDRLLEGNGKIFYRRLVPIPNKILATEAKGGPATIRQAHRAITEYMNDHQLSAPVIPFEYLVTDRSKEADTTKWITKIYYPIV